MWLLTHELQDACARRINRMDVLIAACLPYLTDYVCWHVRLVTTAL